MNTVQGAGGLPIELEAVRKAFGDRQVLAGVDLRIAPGEFVAVVGRSGCGKSTLLRLMAGLEQAGGGELRLGGVAPRADQDDVRMMFQEARLLPWKRVVDNVALGLKGIGAIARAEQVLVQVGLGDRARDWPATLSGGQRQRVALARALVHRPRVLLLDEPLGALDALTRIEMQALIERLWRQLGFTAVLVTHDVAEAVTLADRVLLVEDHRIALDERVSLPRPRQRAHPAFAALEDGVLQRVLAQQDVPASTAPALPLRGFQLRWAI